MEELRGGLALSGVEACTCPVCRETLREPFLTACGHTFCHACVSAHLRHAPTCPVCGEFLSAAQLVPDRALDALLRRLRRAGAAETDAAGAAGGAAASAAKLLASAVQDGVHLPSADVDALLAALADRKRKASGEEAAQADAMLAEFVRRGEAAKREELAKVRRLLACVDADIADLEAWRKSVERAGGDAQVVPHPPEGAATPPEDDARPLRAPRLSEHLSELEECYVRECEDDAGGGGAERRDDFAGAVGALTRFRGLRTLAAMPARPDVTTWSNIVSSLEFDCEDRLFATAGVYKRIRVFDFASVVNTCGGGGDGRPVGDGVAPVVELETRSKLSCLSWNPERPLIASSDYEGVITLWDVEKQRAAMEFDEHEKRVWSVDFSRLDPTQMLSGSDDGRVKVWSTKMLDSTIEVDLKANVCCVQHNPLLPWQIAVGSADHRVHTYDLRQTRAPLNVFSAHRKAVSYVKYISSRELVSASTDSTLRMWDVQTNTPVRTFRGHTNEKNFVGMSVANDYVACGSETNSVFLYHKALSRPFAAHAFATDPGAPDGDGDSSPQRFISALCWKSQALTVVAANSDGTIEVMEVA